MTGFLTVTSRTCLRLSAALAVGQVFACICAVQAQDVAVISSDTRALNEELRRVYWASGGQGYPAAIGATVRILSAERPTSPVTIRVGEKPSACFFDGGKKLVVASAGQSEDETIVSTFETAGGRQVSSFTIPRMRKLWNLPNHIAGPDFTFNDLISKEAGGGFALLAESVAESIAKEPGIDSPNQQCAALATFDESKLGSFTILKTVPSTTGRFLVPSWMNGGLMIGATVLRPPSGRVSQISTFKEPGEYSVLGEIPQHLLGPYAIDPGRQLMFVRGAGQLERVNAAASALVEWGQTLAEDRAPKDPTSKTAVAALLPIGSAGDHIRIVRKMIIPGMVAGASYVIELYKGGANQPEKTLPLGKAVVAVRLNHAMDRVVLLAKESPQLRVLSVDGLKELEVIDHVLDNPTDCAVR